MLTLFSVVVGCRQDLSQAVLMEVLDVADDFKRDFGDGLKAHVDGGRISDDENDENDDN